MNRPNSQKTFSFLKTLALIAAILASGPLRAADPPTGKLEVDEWQVIYLAGQRVGYAHHEIRSRVREGRTHFIADAITAFQMKRFGKEIKITQRQHSEEDSEGNLLQFTNTVDNPPDNHSESTGRVDGKNLLLETVSSGRKHASTMAWTPESKSPFWLERDLLKHPLKDGETRSFQMFESETNKLTPVTVADRGESETGLLDGKRKLRCVRMTMAALPGVVMDSWVDAEGVTLKICSIAMGLDCYTVPREKALEEIGGQLAEVATGTMVKVAAIDRPHEKHRATYRIRVKDGMPAQLIPAGSTQKVRSVAEDTVELQVSSLDPAAALGREEAVAAEYLGSTLFLDFKDPAIQALNRESPETKLPQQAAIALEKLVHQKVKGSYSTAMATASEVARTRQGDCTEYGVLLAALLRARGIPSRVVAGLVYVEKESAFSGHMWTEAWLGGQWIPLDATLGRGRVGVGHIKVADTSLKENALAPVEALLPMIQLLGNVKIELLSLE